MLGRQVRPGTVAAVTPNWFAAVMGTGIVANAAVSLPLSCPGLHSFAVTVWVLAVVELVALATATALQWRRFPATAAGHHRDPVMGHFFGAPAMALLTVGAGTLLIGRDLIGLRAALDADWVLWSAGTALGLVTAVALPYLTFSRHQGGSDGIFGGWLMPVVPPMVSASTGALLLPHVGAGQARLTLLMACYALFGLSLIASLVIITLLWHRLAQHSVGPARLVPTLWIVLGPLGQSITATNLLGGAAHGSVPAPYSDAFAAFGLVYGVPVWGFALLWAALAAALTLRTARTGLPFSLAWWSFVFPLGTLVTGTSGLAARSHADLFRDSAPVLYVALVAVWGLVAVRTARAALHGDLLRLAVPPPSALAG